MTDAERMKEMEELLREARAKICGGFSAMNKQNFHERLNTILDPPPDPDALANTIHGIVHQHTGMAVSIGTGEWRDVCHRIAAWVEADRATTWNLAIETAVHMIHIDVNSLAERIMTLHKPITRNEP